MKTLLVYGTLSGSTMSAAMIVEQELSAKGIEVTSMTADQAAADMLKNYDALVLGSPSWEDEGKDGQPLPEVKKFITSLSTDDLAGKKVAIFGLGDTSYPHFTGAVDVMESVLKEKNSSPVTTSLRIDRYYSLPDNEQKTKDWAEKLAATLSV